MTVRLEQPYRIGRWAASRSGPDVDQIGHPHPLLGGQRLQLVVHAGMLLDHELAEPLQLRIGGLLGAELAEGQLGEAAVGGRRGEEGIVARPAWPATATARPGFRGGDAGPDLARLLGLGSDLGGRRGLDLGAAPGGILGVGRRGGEDGGRGERQCACHRDLLLR